MDSINYSVCDINQRFQCFYNARKRKKFTRKQVADFAGISSKDYQNLEQGIITISDEKIIRIAKILELKIELHE